MDELWFCPTSGIDGAPTGSAGMPFLNDLLYARKLRKERKLKQKQLICECLNRALAAVRTCIQMTPTAVLPLWLVQCAFVV